MIQNNKVLITGGTGTVGYELVKQLSEKCCNEIIIYSRNEISQVEMKRIFPNCTYIIGDIRDYKALKRAMKGMNYVFHLAAIKHIPLCEKQSLEALKTNVHGTINVIKACLKNNVRKLIYMSTDKAENPSSFYGMTKLMSENLVKNSGLKYSIVRSGNIFGSSGSVVPLFISQVEKSNCITITDGNMTRFFILVQDLVKYLINACEFGINSDLICDSLKIKDLANAIIFEYGNEKTELKEIGIRPGERMNEFMNGKSSDENLISKEQIVQMLRTWKETI
jgi:UDP-N-acetylglucosamine 4,6-dehydratase/5-epimerase